MSTILKYVTILKEPPNNISTLVQEEVVTEPEFQLENQVKDALGPEYGNDIGLWKNITNEVQNFWCSRDPSECQNLDEDFSASTRQYEDHVRVFTRSMIFRKHVSGTQIKREWLMYSPSSGNVYCFPCVLFNEHERGKTRFTNGFSDWRNASQRMRMHENSAEHRSCMQTLISRRRSFGRIDSSLEVQFNKEREYWMQVLRRVVSVVKFLSSRGLAFRGDTEFLGLQNNGNYLGILELIAEYDPFLSSHLAKYGNQGRGKCSYLSSTICEEVIEVMGKKVLNAIVEEIKEAKYYSLSVDSTPDVSHIDQLTIVIRYVRSSDGKVNERFLTFIPISSHTGEDLATTVLTFLNGLGIDVENMRGQSYDNAANMSGCYNGLQSHISNINKLAIYIPCAAHSLNLVGVSAVESCVGAISFFGFVQTLYNFMSASTHRWEVMLKCLNEDEIQHSDPERPKHQNPVLKRVTSTRWSAKADAMRALFKGYNYFKIALQTLADDTNQKPEAVHEARCLLTQMSKKEIFIMTEFWAVILERINAVSMSLQSETVELQTAVRLLNSLLEFLKSQRDQFDYYEQKASELQYSDEGKRKRVRKRHFDDGNAENVVLQLQVGERFKVETYLPILDKLSAELCHRLKAYETVNSVFGVLCAFPALTDAQIKEGASKLLQNYANDVEAEFGNEMVHFKYFMSQLEDFNGKQVILALQSYNVIFENKLQSTFPNVTTALKLYLSLMITNATGERSFSKMKIIKNCHRSTMVQNRLASLAIMASENDVLQKLEFEDVLSSFVSKKLRKVNL